MTSMSYDKSMHDGNSELIPLELVPDPFVLLKADSVILDANMTFANLVGAEKKDFIGKGYSSIAILNALSDKITRCISSGYEDYDRTTFEDRHFEVMIMPYRHPGHGLLLRIIMKDITGFVRLEKELLRRNKELIIINTLSSAFISSENMDLVMEDLIEKVLLITDFHAGWIVIAEDARFRLKTAKGISKDFMNQISEGNFDDICNDALRLIEPIYIIEQSTISKIKTLRKEGIVFLIAVPLRSSHQTNGLLFLASKSSMEIDFDFAALLSLVGNHVSHILDKISLFHETKRLAITDGLTGLYNSRYFYKYLDLEIARAKRYGSTFSLILFDIDNFKKMNDTYGHQAGDEVLQELARMLRSVSRETDVVVRYGGEEFIIILPNTAEDEAISLAERILKTIQDTKIRINDNETVSVTLSGGIASYPLNALSAKSLLNAADSAMYAAKAAGKNTLVCFKGKRDEKSI